MSGRLLAKVMRCTCNTARGNRNKVFQQRNLCLPNSQVPPYSCASSPAGLGCFSDVLHARLYSVGDGPQSTVSRDDYTNISPFRKFKHSLGLLGDLKVPYKTLQLAGYRAWLSCSEIIDHTEIVQGLGLPDTFNTWYLIMELHVWMIMTRLISEGIEGRYFRNVLVGMMWKDVENRMKEMGHEVMYSYRKEFLQRKGDQFQHTLLSYDEGLLSDDRVLASALWVRLFERHDVDAKTVETIVRYVRKQIYFIDQMDSASLLNTGIIEFEPFTEGRTKKDMHQIKQNIDKVTRLPRKR